MKRLLCILLVLAALCSLAACGTPMPDDAQTTIESTQAVTEAPWETEEAKKPGLEPSWAVSDTHFYAVGFGYGKAPGRAPYYAPLDDLGNARRIPLPIHYQGDWYTDFRIDKLDGQWLYLTGLAGTRYVQMRVDTETFRFEYLGESKDKPAFTPPAQTPPMEPDEFSESYRDAYKRLQAEALPRPAYEFTGTFAKTPTHIFATRSKKAYGDSATELYRMPLGNLSKQEKISLPGKIDELAICGLTEKWLFVGCGQADEDDNLQRVVTYRISLDTLKAERIDEGKTEWPYPRYNAASNSLLYIKGTTVEALGLDTGKRGVIFDFGDYYKENQESSRISGWYNTADGSPVLKTLVGWWGGIGTCFVFEKDGTVRIADEMDLPRAKTPPDYTPGKAEQELEARDDVLTHTACGAYVYYAEGDYSRERNLYRMKPDGTGKELLRAGTHIYQLMSVKDKLFCLAYTPYTAEDGTMHDGEEVGFYSLDDKGKLLKVIDNGYDGEWGWSSWERLGDFIMFVRFGVNGSETGLQSIYDPATGAVFYAYDKEKQEGA